MSRNNINRTDWWMVADDYSCIMRIAGRAIIQIATDNLGTSPVSDATDSWLYTLCCIGENLIREADRDNHKIYPKEEGEDR